MDFTADLSGRVAVITGATGGIGCAVAFSLVNSGASVVITDHPTRQERLFDLAARLSAGNRRVRASAADVSSRADVDQLMGDVLDAFGGVDLLVNVAGVYLTGVISAFEESAWDQTMSVNLKAPFLTCQAFSKVMCRQGQGIIVNVASDSAVDVAAGDGPYGSSKAALVALTRHLAKELGEYGVRANAVAPGWVKTEMTRFVWSDPAALQEAEAAIPLGFMAEPADIADVVLFLASEASRYVSGQLIVANGGRV